MSELFPSEQIGAGVLDTGALDVGVIEGLGEPEGIEDEDGVFVALAEPRAVEDAMELPFGDGDALEDGTVEVKKLDEPPLSITLRSD
jgi:hypothetical protein